MTAPHSVARAGLRRDAGSAPSMSSSQLADVCSRVPCVLRGLVQGEVLALQREG